MNPNDFLTPVSGVMTQANPIPAAGAGPAGTEAELSRETLDPAAVWAGATLRSPERIYGYTWADPHSSNWIACRRTANHDEVILPGRYVTEEAARLAVDACYDSGLGNHLHLVAPETDNPAPTPELTPDELRRVRVMLSDYEEYPELFRTAPSGSAAAAGVRKGAEADLPLEAHTVPAAVIYDAPSGSAAASDDPAAAE